MTLPDAAAIAKIQANKAPDYRGRLAPSPTGYLHAGHARTFWIASRRAREAHGALVLRMEDLDAERSKPAYAGAALEDLRWLGIDWQEGPDCGGPFSPYVQSQRMALYLAAWGRLVRGGYLFPCRCSRKDIEAAASAPHEHSEHSDRTDPADRAGRAAASGELETDDEPVYAGTCRPDTIGGAQDRPLHVFKPSVGPESPNGVAWRFRVPDGEVIEFEDRNLGRQRFVAGEDFGDFVVWRRDGNPASARTGSGVPYSGAPSYQLACVVDDAAMRITEVVRGADLLKSTARQILLNRALGYIDPAWYHCRLVVDGQGRRLAKRFDALSVLALRERGLTPGQVLSSAFPVEA